MIKFRDHYGIDILQIKVILNQSIKNLSRPYSHSRAATYFVLLRVNLSYRIDSEPSYYVKGEQGFQLYSNAD